jgi:3-oxoacyl-[acyl-carrier protein] reductase
MNLEGKNLLIAGGSSGIGLSLIKKLVSAGANIYTICRSVSPEWPQGVKHLPIDVLGDLTSLTTFLPGQLNGLVYSIGSINLKPFGRLTAEDFMNDYSLNVVGAAMIIQKSLKALKNAPSASIVLISSVAAQTGFGYHASISAAKSGLEGMALSLAAELAADNIRVNVVAPSITDTPLAQTLLSTPEKREASAKRHPLGQFGKQEDISSAITFLLSEESDWITGQVLGIDGGLSKLKV